MLERLFVRPQLAMFESLLKRRVDQLQNVEHPGIARPRAVERDSWTGELVVVAEFAAGSRLSDLLDASADAVVVPGVDVALGYLLSGLEALSALHQRAKVTHGLIDPSRTIVSADGQVVFVDLAFGSAIERLHLSTSRLWNDFGAAGWGPSEAVRFDATADVTQAAVSALLLVLGRALGKHEYPDALPPLLLEFVEVAQIRGSSGFAGSLQKFFQRALPLPGRRPFASADEAASDLRQLVRRDIGLDVCRRAVVDFVAQMDAVFTSAAEREAEAIARAAHVDEAAADAIDDYVDDFESVETAASSDPDLATPAEPSRLADDGDEDQEDELEISLEQLNQPAPRAKVEEEVYELPSFSDLSLSDASAISSELESYQDRPREPQPAPRAAVPESSWSFESDVVSTPAPIAQVEPEWPTHDKTERFEQTAIQREFADVREPEPQASAATETADADAEALADAGAQDDEHHSDFDGEPEKESGSSRRRKRQQQKSARARKDKLRSTTADQKPPVPPPPAVPPPPRPANPSGWLVSPQRAAASEMLIPEPAPPAPVRHVPTMPSFAPTPVSPFAQPSYPSPVAQTPYGTPSVIKPAPPAPPPPPPKPSAAPALKLKSESTPAMGIRRGHEPIVTSPVDRFSTLSLGGRSPEAETSRQFPWKLAGIAVAVAALAIVLGRSYLPGRTAVEGEAGAPTEAAAPGTSPTPSPTSETPIPAGKGRIAIQSQPSGIRVLLDRKAIGETPVQVDTTPGRHLLTFLTSGGEVVQTVRVTAGKVTPFDAPVFSGWLTVVTPFVVEVARDGQEVGTSEESRLMLPPGRHKITLTNKELGFSHSQQVDIEPGGVRTLSLNPKGTAHINADPWAEVWLEGAKLGDTPLAGIQVPLGTREFVFKHPQYGEKRVTITIRANAPTTIAHDFTKDKD